MSLVAAIVLAESSFMANFVEFQTISGSSQATNKWPKHRYFGRVLGLGELFKHVV